MLSRRHMIATAAAGVAASSPAQLSEAATPANILVMAKTIDGIVGAFDPAESYENANNEACGPARLLSHKNGLVIALPRARSEVSSLAKR
jgi:hypothetical protein